MSYPLWLEHLAMRCAKYSGVRRLGGTRAMALSRFLEYPNQYGGLPLTYRSERRKESGGPDR